MTPLKYAVSQILSNNDSVLDLCCGIGDVICDLQYASITGVDAYEKYVEIYKDRPKANAIQFDLSKISQSDNAIFSSFVLRFP
jgi:ubiquinone/menaquinone biosynthesis C-methylase UbiE